MFGMKKRISMVAELDLRNYSVEALNHIRSISMVATIILPSDADEDWYSAFGNIKVNQCASIIRLEKNAVVSKVNGFTILDDTNTEDNGYYFINGCCLIKTIEKKPFISCNGFCLKYENAVLDVKHINGTITEIPKDTVLKFYPDSAEIDADTVRNLDANVTVAAGDKICIADDVSEECLKEKNIKFIAGDKIICCEHIFGYVNANSQVGDKIEKKTKK